jgi:Sulfotransferase domain
MALPNFLIIGAAKAGTTSLWHYLTAHPDIFMSKVKEPDYFKTHKNDRRGVTETLEAYERLFEGSGSFDAVGEASPTYFADEQAVRKIKETLPGVKLVAILRDPCSRAFSEFTFQRLRGEEPIPDFLTAIEADASRTGDTRIDYIGFGLYHRNLSRYFAEFPAERIKVVFNEDLRRDAQRVVSDIFGFLGVDPTVRVSTEAELMVSGVPRVKLLHWLLGRHNLLKDTIGPWLPGWARDAARKLKNANLQRQSMTETERAAIHGYFADDIRQLEQLLRVDLGHWRAR